MIHVAAPICPEVADTTEYQKWLLEVTSAIQTNLGIEITGPPILPFAVSGAGDYNDPDKQITYTRTVGEAIGRYNILTPTKFVNATNVLMPDFEADNFANGPTTTGPYAPFTTRIGEAMAALSNQIRWGFYGCSVIGPLNPVDQAIVDEAALALTAYGIGANDYVFPTAYIRRTTRQPTPAGVTYITPTNAKNRVKTTVERFVAAMPGVKVMPILSPHYYPGTGAGEGYGVLSKTDYLLAIEGAEEGGAYGIAWWFELYGSQQASMLAYNMKQALLWG